LLSGCFFNPSSTGLVQDGNFLCSEASFE
jgi:hypothetical protein